MWDLAGSAGKTAAIVHVASMVPYISSILKGKTKPSRTSWWIWTALGTVLATSHILVGGRESAWLPIVYAIDPLIIALLSIKYGQKGWSRLDSNCLIGAAFALALWIVVQKPLLVLVTTLAVDSLASIPTVRKVWAHPHSEDLLAWTMVFSAASVNLLAIENWSSALYPSFLAGLAGLVTLIIWTRRTAEPTLLSRTQGNVEEFA